MLQADSAQGGQSFLAGRAPFTVLNEMAEAGIIRREAPNFNILVTESDVERALLRRFGPPAIEGQEVSPGQLEREYKENYQAFLESRHLSDSDYREFVEERLYRGRLRDKLGERVPSLGEQVEVHWIRPPEGEGAPDAAQIRERLETEDFAAVAGEVSIDRAFSDTNGYVGWVPRGAFPGLDPIFFGTDEEEPIARNVISKPLRTPDGSTYILKVTAGPERGEISDLMRERLKDRALEDELLKQKEIGGREGWFEFNWNSDLYSWVFDQVYQAAPRVTPPAGG